MDDAAASDRTQAEVTQAAQLASRDSFTTSIAIHESSPTSTSSSEASLPHHAQSSSHSQSGNSERSDSGVSVDRQSRRKHRLQRPPLGTRKSSGTIIIPREQSPVAQDERYDDNDARAMSPRRSQAEIHQMSEQARQALEEQSQALQSSLLEIIERVDSVKTEHEKLEGGNKFLQSYIGELMQTSKITATGPPKSKKGQKK
ncbi:MAG: hypothetical protein Q9159_005953 [Coniocarpon cinnabarinum]